MVSAVILVKEHSILPSIKKTGLTSDQLQDFLLYHLGITTVSEKVLENLEKDI